jgi:hypothetical protein
MSDHISADLARQLHHALTCGGDELFTLLQEKSTDVLHAALKNPACAENHLLALLKRRELKEEEVKTLFGHPVAQASHAVKVALAHHPATPAPQLANLLPQLHLFELVTLCHLPGATADLKTAAERAIIQRLPGIQLGSKITLARRATALVLEALVKEGDPLVIAPSLDNPHLKEGSLYQLIRSSTTSQETLSLIARHPRWQSRPNLKLAILGNPRTPSVWFTRFLPSLTTAELKRLVASSITSAQKNEVRLEMKRRGI